MVKRSHGYTFGDDAAASARLALLAQLFGPTTRSLLAPLHLEPRRIIDLGCGPGHTTRLLAARFTDAEVVGVERSAAFLHEARAAAPDRCRFVDGDVTTLPLPGAPADLVYARYLLSHLPDPRGLLTTWTTQLAPRGLLVLEEPEAIVTDDDLFRRYLTIVDDLMASEGGELYTGRMITGPGRDPAGLTRRVDQVATIDLPADRVAEMFWLNSRAWADHPRIVSHHDPGAVHAVREELDRRRAEPATATARWEIRQVVVERGER